MTLECADTFALDLLILCSKAKNLANVKKLLLSNNFENNDEVILNCLLT